MPYQTHQKSATLYNKCYLKNNPIAVSPSHCPTKKEAQEILKGAEKRKAVGTKAAFRDWIFVRVVMNTGIRVSEFSHLREDHVVCTATYYEHIQVFISKTRHGLRIIPLNHQIILDIQEYRKKKEEWGESLHNNEFFLRSSRKSEDGNRFRRESLYRAFKRVMKHVSNVEKPTRFTTHSMRHSFATRLYENQKIKDVKSISELLGHASEQVTSQVYIHVFVEQKIEIVKNLYI